VIKKRGPQPNINLTLWHFARHLKHYKHLGQNNLNDIVDKYLESNDYVDTALRDHGEKLLKDGMPSVADALPGGESKSQEPTSRPPAPKPPAMETPARPPPAMETSERPVPSPVLAQSSMETPPAMERPETPQAPSRQSPQTIVTKHSLGRGLGRGELRKWAAQHRHMGIDGNSKSEDIRRAMERHRHEEAAKTAMRAVGKFISISKKNEPPEHKKRPKATTPRRKKRKPIYRQFVDGNNSKEAIMARIEARRRGR